MDTEPVSYDALKSVLQYMDPNFRFLISLLIPSIKSAEKSVPLKINYLAFYTWGVHVNNVIYSLGICRDYRGDEDEVTKKHNKENQCGGVTHDLDQWGLPDRSSNDILEPGDVFINNSREEEVDGPRTHEAQLEQLQAQLQLAENQEELNEVHISDLKDRIDEYKYWTENIEPPFDLLIQFIIRSPDAKMIFRKKYDCKLYEIIKKLTEAMFGERRLTVKVTNFFLYSNLLRLPVGLKFKIKGRMQFNGKVKETYESLKSIIDESSYPLSLIDIDGHLDCFEHDIVKNAKDLNIVNYHQENWLPILSNLKHRRMHMRIIDDNSFSNENQIIFIQNWIDNGRPNHTAYSFGINEDQSCKDLMELIKHRYNRTSLGRHGSIGIPMNNLTSMLSVWYEPVEDVKLQRLESKFILKMKVYPYKWD